MAAKAKPRKVVPIVLDDDDDENDCPRCPPVGAPAWMATFADMATLLMAFFVLILSFANFDEVSFKKMTGALREHFGVKIVEILNNPESTTILEMDFRPASDPPAPQDSPDPQNDSAQSQMMQDLIEALADALDAGQLAMSNADGVLSLRLPDGAELQELAQTLAQSVQDFAAQTQGGAEQDAPQGGDDDQSASGDAGQDSAARAAIADARLRVALRELQDQGLVDVQQEQDRVVVTVGAGGAFSSGSADLTAQAQDIMARIAETGVGDGARVTVTGHTDSVPLTGGPFRDNWGLAAARASSVVRELGARGLAAPNALSAVSRGEADPVAPNDTEAGREANRRIEIQFDYGANQGR